MSKTGNYLVGLTETTDYIFGAESAERGEPRPKFHCDSAEDLERLKAQTLGWNDWHNMGESA